MEKKKAPLGLSINPKREESAKSAVVVNGVTIAEVTHNTIGTEEKKEPKPAEQATPPVANIPSIEELQARAEKTSQLVKRYQTVKEKKAEIDRFTILHDSENSKIYISDEDGRSITTSNPKSIAQVIDIWKKDINEALAKAEQEVREIMTAPQATLEVLKQVA